MSLQEAKARLTTGKSLWVVPKDRPVTLPAASSRTCHRAVASGSPRPVPAQPTPATTGGAGTELKAVLKWFRFFAQGGCGCNAHAINMDQKGTTWCRANISTIVMWLEVEAKRRKLPFSRLAAEQLVKLAIRRAEKKERKRKAVAPVISIVMPTYNQAKYLREALDSILAQTFTDWELVVVDDGSADDTAAIVKVYTDPRIRYLYKENGGTGSALNAGFALARGQYETWFASDNVLLPTALASLKEYLESNPKVDWVYANFDFKGMDQKGEKIVSTVNAKKLEAREYAPGKLITGYYFGIIWLWRKAAHEKIGPFWEKPCEDYDFALRAEEAGIKCEFLDKNLGWYRDHRDTLTQNLVRNGTGVSLHTDVICQARIRRFPRKAHFYWGAKTLPYLRYLTLETFCRWNPDWQVALYRPHKLTEEKPWKSADGQYEVGGRDWMPAVHKLPIAVKEFDPRELGLSESLSEIHKSDLLRLQLLSGEHGGLWSDMDIIYFAPLTLPLIHDTYLCDGPERHLIGFMAATPFNPIFQLLFNEAKQACQGNGDLHYQSVGADLFDKYRDKFPEIDKAWGNWGCYRGKAIYNIPEDVVYAYNWKQVGPIHKYPLREPLQFTDRSIGLHWFGGNPVAGESCSKIAPENSLKQNTVLGEAIRMAMRAKP